MHPFITRYREDPKTSVLFFCEAALAFSTELITNIWKYIPEGTAANYVSKIRVLREFIVDNNLESRSASELVKILSETRNINAARDISRRKLNAEYASARSAKEDTLSIDDLMRHLEALDRHSLIEIQNLIALLLVQK